MGNRMIHYVLMAVIVAVCYPDASACYTDPTPYLEFKTTDLSDYSHPYGPEDHYDIETWPHAHCVRIGSKGLGLSMNASSVGSSMGANSFNPHVAEWFTEDLDGRSNDLDVDLDEHIFERLDRWQSGIREWAWIFGDSHEYGEWMYENGYNSDWVWCIGDFGRTGHCSSCTFEGGEGEGHEWAINANHFHFYENAGYYDVYLTVTDDDEFEGVSQEDHWSTCQEEVLAFDMEISCEKSVIAVGELVPVTLSFSPNPCDTGWAMLEIGEFQDWYIDGVKVWADSDRNTQLLPHNWPPPYDAWNTKEWWDPPHPTYYPEQGLPSTVWVEATEVGNVALDLSFLINYGGETVSMDRLVLKAVQVNITVNLEDPQVNGVRSGLDESTLRFELNGVMIPSSSLTIGRTYELIDGENVLTSMSISYHPSGSELTFGTNTVKVDIDDMVDNHMPQLVQTFEI